MEFTPCIDERPAFSGWTPEASATPRYNQAPAFARNRSSLSGPSSSFSSGSRFGGSSFGGSRSSIPESVRKNDRRIVYRNPVKVASPAKSVDVSGPRIVYDEYSENPYHPGVRVRHTKYGVGTIVKCYGTGDNARVDVRFGNDPTIRTIVLKYAALQIVG